MPHLRPCTIDEFYALLNAVCFAVKLRGWRCYHWIDAERCQRFVGDVSGEGRARVVPAKVSKRVGKLAGLVVGEFDVHGSGNVVGPDGITVCARQEKLGSIGLEEGAAHVSFLEENGETHVVTGGGDVPGRGQVVLIYSFLNRI